jgi:S-(hydroxymethyl)glutathione dehydrogenase/alcohol dehydrogenase
MHIYLIYLGTKVLESLFEVGPDVAKVESGDRVVLGWIKGSGIEAGGVQYKCSDGILNGGGVTTFNDYAVVSENRCVKDT